MCDIIQPMEHKPMVKRTLEEMEDGSDEQEEGEMEVAEGAQFGGTKRAKEEGTSDDRQQDQVQSCTQPDMNYHLPDETGLPCLLKVRRYHHVLHQCVHCISANMHVSYNRHIIQSDVCVQVYGRVGGCVWGVERMGSCIL